ncbi:hypothetical protein C8J57DRAFT_1222778 [Mycena rebaudengoi]|nr:hypothetical protein C8J57DRAFT_1222778 [Mycena rebaudengoi]
MKFSTAFFALIPFVAATALPPVSQIQGNVRVCTDAGFTGDCFTLNGGSTQCENLPGSLNDKVSSFGPDGGQDCFIFVFFSSDAGCTGAQLGPIRFPGISNLQDVNFNDKMSSWKLVLLRVKRVLVREKAHGSSLKSGFAASPGIIVPESEVFPLHNLPTSLAQPKTIKGYLSAVRSLHVDADLPFKVTE